MNQCNQKLLCKTKDLLITENVTQSLYIFREREYQWAEGDRKPYTAINSSLQSCITES